MSETDQQPLGHAQSRGAVTKFLAAAMSHLRGVPLGVLVALGLRVFCVEAYLVDGSSMEPGLLAGERVAVLKYAYGVFPPFADAALITWASPRAGDIVVVKSPADNVTIIKRVAGVGGDLVELRDDELYRNGQPMGRADGGRCVLGTGGSDRKCRVYENLIEGRKYTTSGAGRSPDTFPVRVPDGHVFLLGDHRDVSNDSRNPDVGPIEVSRIVGRAFATYWSPGDLGMRWTRMFQRLQ